MKKYLLIISLTLTSLYARADIVVTDEVEVNGLQFASFVESGEDRSIKSIGVAIPEKSLSRLPEHETKFILRLPNNPKLKPYQFIEVNWNPHGHEPPGIYHLPHFDFHFYTMPRAAVLKISCQGADEAICKKMPAANHVAPNYVPAPAGTPQMGWHWVDILSPEFNGGLFTKTFIYGYYNGVVNFLEPMVTLDFLKSKEHVILPVRQPAHFAQPGSYPQKYEIGFNNKRKLHYVRLIHFKKWTD